MADKSTIEWTDATWNPVTGCTKVSPGCDHCYAERVTERFHGKGSFANVTLHEDRIEQPLRWRKPRRVFVNSMADLFHDDVPDLFIERVFEVMEKAQHHTFQVLTKRHARMRSFVKAREQRWAEYAAKFDHCPTEAMRNSPAAQWARKRAVTPPANIWLGVSVENQQWADIRIPALLGTPAAVRFLSCEPLLGPVDLRPHFGAEHLRHMTDGRWHDDCRFCLQRREEGGMGVPPLNWVIVGGESGPGARPMHPDWARQLRDQCTAAGVPFFFKQWGGWAPLQPGTAPGRPIRAYPGALLQRVGKKAAGRELDGRTHDEYPEVPRG